MLCNPAFSAVKSNKGYIIIIIMISSLLTPQTRGKPMTTWKKVADKDLKSLHLNEDVVNREISEE